MLVERRSQLLRDFEHALGSIGMLIRRNVVHLLHAGLDLLALELGLLARHLFRVELLRPRLAPLPPAEEAPRQRATLRI